MSERSGPTARDGAVLLAEAGWSSLQDLVVFQLCHDLNGRLASLRAASELARMGEPVPGAVEREVDRLEHLVGLLAILVGELDAPPVPMSFDGLLRQALELYGLLAPDADSGLIEREEGAASPSVLVSERRALRSLLLFVHHAGGAPTAAAPALRVATDPAGVSVSFAPPSGEMEPALLRALDGLLRLDGGSVRLEAGRCSLRLPSLVASRAPAPHPEA